MSFAYSVAPILTRVDWERTVGNVADWVTLGAFTITLIGLLSAFLTRGRLRSSIFTAPPSRSFTWTLSNMGSSPVRQIAYHPAWITRTGRPVAGDGTIPLVQALYPGESFRIEIFDSEDISWSGDERANELRMASSSSADGAVIVLTWRNAVIPWRRRRRALIFMFGQPQIELRGRRARRVSQDLLSMDPENLPAAIQLELSRANGGVPPSEQRIQDRYPREVDEISPHVLAQGIPSQRVQLWLGTELLADGRLEGHMYASAPDARGVGTGTGTGSWPQGNITIDGQKFDLNESHRIRTFAR
ncbi:hypothetical protein FHX49_000369 [Microbacterium endophyticum]|uniref:Uncharacterized protein n=1 Tax=Microbacterium endophyticum TaxID=1526412 RepID=A0A7W4YL59_9MICO|nr:hypothetical protein [Microbacterium endophyticum]MBB2974828.1 hypothetical protein [Microbacterium endophyticum]NIK37125.1 hypothetical protein [Microbacterium endophyticum]